MSLRTGNATRDRILAARDEFRASALESKPQEAPAVASPSAGTAPTTGNVEVKAVDPNNIEVPENFIKSVNELGSVQLNTQPVPAEEDKELKAARDENAKLQKELEELRKARESDAASLQELNKLRQKQRVDEYLSSINDISSINPDDARKLISPLLQRMDDAQQESQKKLQETRAVVDQRLAELDKRNVLNKHNQMYAQILKAHPDLQQLQQSQAYKDMMLSPVQAGSAITIGELVTAELKNGNADYVIKVLDSVKQRSSTPSLADVASVSGANVAVGATGREDRSGDRLTPDQIASYRFKVQTGEMSRDEFRQVMARHREASKLH